MKKEIAITAYKCKKCGKIHYPYHDRCLACKSREFEPLKPEGDARLLALSHPRCSGIRKPHQSHGSDQG
jgi:uncharacterized OB-fold protein